MAWRWMVVILLMVMSGCAAGAPLGFQKGTNWSVPLVGTLDNGIPLAQVEIDGHGPYLFAVNLDALSMIDPDLANELGLWETRTTQDKAVDENDDVTIEQLTYSEIPRFTLGNLTVSSRRFITMRTGSSYNGHPVLGVIGRDVISETLIWTLDRDRAMLHLATQGHQTPPPGAMRVDLSLYRGQIFVNTKIDDKVDAELRVLFNGASQIWPELADKAEMRRLDLSGSGPYERWVAQTVQIGEVHATEHPFFAFHDKRVREVEYDGTLGMEMWSRYRITVNLHQRVMWLEPRPDDVAVHANDRLLRWNPMARGCRQPACAFVVVIDGDRVASIADAARTPSQGPILVFTRETPAYDQEVEFLLQAIDRDGAPLPAPLLRVAMPAGLRQARFLPRSLDPGLARAASFRVIETTPFPPPCQSPSGCLWLQD